TGGAPSRWGVVLRPRGDPPRGPAVSVPAGLQGIPADPTLLPASGAPADPAVPPSPDANGAPAASPPPATSAAPVSAALPAEAAALAALTGSVQSTGPQTPGVASATTESAHQAPPPAPPRDAAP